MLNILLFPTFEVAKRNFHELFVDGSSLHGLTILRLNLDLDR